MTASRSVLWHWFLLVWVVFAPPSAAFADEIQINENPLTARLRIEPDTVAPGQAATVVVEINLAEGHHAYLDQFRFRLIKPDPLAVGEFDIAPVVSFFDKFSKKERKGVEQTATLKAELRVPAKLASGPVTAEFELTYQACTKDYCLWPKKIPLTADLRIAGSPGSDAETAATATAFLDFDAAMERSWLLAFFIVFLGGVLTSFTPCIFPMIPITLAVLGAKTAGRRRLTGFLLSLAYVLGIALTYSILGVFAASTGMLFGSALGHPLVVGAIAAIFVAMALSMYGLYDLQVPAAIANRLGNTKAGGGFVGAFVTGLIAGVVASPCVGPVLISILTFVAKTQNLFLGFWLLFTFALGMGLLFLALGTFGHWIGRLPRSGPWMEGVKFVFGSVMLAMAIYYLAPVLPERWTQALIGFTLIGVSSAFGAFYNAPSMNLRHQLRKGLLLAAFVLGLLFLQRALFAPARPATTGAVDAAPTATASRVPWQPYSESALKNATANGRPVILDFYADWCVACKELDVFTFSTDEVLKAAGDTVWLQFDATTSSEEFRALKERYGIQGLPHVVFFTASGQRRDDLTLRFFESKEKFLERLARR